MLKRNRDIDLLPHWSICNFDSVMHVVDASSSQVLPIFIGRNIKNIEYHYSIIINWYEKLSKKKKKKQRIWFFFRIAKFIWHKRTVTRRNMRAQEQEYNTAYKAGKNTPYSEWNHTKGTSQTQGRKPKLETVARQTTSVNTATNCNPKTCRTGPITATTHAQTTSPLPPGNPNQKTKAIYQNNHPETTPFIEHTRRTI